MMKLVRMFASVVVLATASTGAVAKELIVFCAGAVKPVLSLLGPVWEAQSGNRLQVTYASAGDLRKQLAAGEGADIAILPLENFTAMEKDGLASAASRRNLGAVGIGVAVREGARLPDVSSEDGLKRALLEAKSVAFMDPTRGTSGKHVDEVVLPKLGIRDAVRAKAVLGEGGMIAEKVANGEVEIAFQQMTELLPVTGIRVAGALPPSLQKTTVYSGAVMMVAKSPTEAAALLSFLVSSDGRATFLAKGFSAP
jgi:molybdate transport system substrate-binding protein